jgi:hypothetical protein
MPTFVADSDVLAEVAAIHRLDPGNAPASWSVIVAKANAWAYRKILRVLAGRGFSPEQIAQWDDGEVFNQNLALCQALRKIGLPENQESMSLSEICKSNEELATVDFTIGGEIVAPAVSTATISTGGYDTTDDTFTMDSKI